MKAKTPSPQLILNSPWEGRAVLLKTDHHEHVVNNKKFGGITEFNVIRWWYVLGHAAPDIHKGGFKSDSLIISVCEGENTTYARVPVGYVLHPESVSV